MKWSNIITLIKTKAQNQLKIELKKAIFSTEQIFDSYMCMCEKVDSVKGLFEKRLDAFKMGSDEALDIDSMEDYFKECASFHFKLIDQMNDFVADVGLFQLALNETIYDVDLDFNKALKSIKSEETSGREQ